jgi:hypothetical protein
VLILLPVLTFLALFLDLLHGQEGGAQDFAGWRRPFLLAALLCGGWVVIVTEGLSLFSALARGWVAALWAVALLAAVVFGSRRGLLRIDLAKLRNSLQTTAWPERLILAGLACVVVTLFLVAWVSPPNNTDSLQYHMSRVVHWAQNHSLRHYPTAFEPQLYSPIWAEATILNLRLLWGSDQPANLVQWFSMVGSLVGASAIAGFLGARLRGQLVAAAFAASIPMGILQASSTQNDYVTAFWLVCLAYFAVLGARRALTAVEWLGMALALGLGMLTKGTFYPYAVPFGIWIAVSQTRRTGLGRAFSRGVLALAVAMLLNLGFWARNLATFGDPLAGLARGNIGRPSLGSVALRFVEHAALNFSMPGGTMNARLTTAVSSFSQLLGQDSSNFQLIWSWNHEDLAGSPIHLLLVPVTGLVLLILHRRVPDRRVFGYALATLATSLVYAFAISFDVYGARHQVPFFAAWAPVAGLAASLIGERRFAPLAAAGLLVLTLPWLLLNRSRPLIGMYPRTMTASILQVGPADIMFANWPALRGPYDAVAQGIRTSGCRSVGLRIDSHDPEYFIWWLLEAPQSGIRIQTIYTFPRLERYIDPSFRPCAIVCTICTGQTRLHGLDRLLSIDGVDLFVGDGFVPEEGASRDEPAGVSRALFHLSPNLAQFCRSGIASSDRVGSSPGRGRSARLHLPVAQIPCSRYRMGKAC